MDAYNTLGVFNKTPLSDPGSLSPLLLCVKTLYDIIEHDKCCLDLK